MSSDFIKSPILFVFVGNELAQLRVAAVLF